MLQIRCSNDVETEAPGIILLLYPDDIVICYRFVVPMMLRQRLLVLFYCYTLMILLYVTDSLFQ